MYYFFFSLHYRFNIFILTCLNVHTWAYAVFTRNNSARAGPRLHAPARADEFMRNNSEVP